VTVRYGKQSTVQLIYDLHAAKAKMTSERPAFNRSTISKT